MKKEKIILSILSLLLFTSCLYEDNRLVINNKSEFTIYVDVSKDTVLKPVNYNLFKISSYFIKAHSKKNIVKANSNKAWEGLAKNSINKQLHIFIFSEDTLKKYDTNSIIKTQKYEKRIDISIEELKATNWEVVYEH